MAWYYDDGESREDANRAVQRELSARRKRGENLEPVLPQSSRDLSTTFWGQAWNRNLMAYRACLFPQWQGTGHEGGTRSDHQCGGWFAGL